MAAGIRFYIPCLGFPFPRSVVLITVAMTCVLGLYSWAGKIVIHNKIIEQVNLFNDLLNVISYERELDIDNKLNNFLQITCIV